MINDYLPWTITVGESTDKMRADRMSPPITIEFYPGGLPHKTAAEIMDDINSLFNARPRRDEMIERSDPDLIQKLLYRPIKRYDGHEGLGRIFPALVRKRQK